MEKETKKESEEKIQKEVEYGLIEVMKDFAAIYVGLASISIIVVGFGLIIKLV